MSEYSRNAAAYPSAQPPLTYVEQCYHLLDMQAAFQNELYQLGTSSHAYGRLSEEEEYNLESTAPNMRHVIACREIPEGADPLAQQFVIGITFRLFKIPPGRPKKDIFVPFAHTEKNQLVHVYDEDAANMYHSKAILYVISQLAKAQRDNVLPDLNIHLTDINPGYAPPIYAN